MRILKTAASLLVLFAMLISFASCGLISGEQDTSNYPDGSIAITPLTFHLFFEVEVSATCEYNHDRGVTEAVAYVALKPRAKMREAVGKITFSVDTRVFKPLGGGEWKISNSDETLLLKSNGVTESYKMTIQEPYSERNSWRVDETTLAITVKDAWGYVILDDAS